MYIVILLSVGILLVAILLLGVRVFFTRGGKFPDTHIGDSKAMRERGIHCAQTQDRQARRKKTIFHLTEIDN